MTTRSEFHRHSELRLSLDAMAKLLEASLTLMRLRELQVLEKIASAGKLNIVLG